MATQANDVGFIVGRLKRLASASGNVYHKLGEAALLVREAIALGAFSAAKFCVFRDFFDPRHDRNQRHRLWLAFCAATDWLADNAADLWGDDTPRFSDFRFKDGSGRGVPRIYWAERIPAVAELIERQILTDTDSDTGDIPKEKRIGKQPTNQDDRDFCALLSKNEKRPKDKRKTMRQIFDEFKGKRAKDDGAYKREFARMKQAAQRYPHLWRGE